MKHKIFGGIAVLAIAAAIAFNVTLSKQSNGLSNVSLANVEALAEETGGFGYYCCNSGRCADLSDGNYVIGTAQTTPCK